MAVNTFRTAIPHSVNPQLRDKVSETGRDPADLEVISLVGPEVHQNILDAVEACGATSIPVDVLPGARDPCFPNSTCLPKWSPQEVRQRGDETSGSLADTWLRLPTRWSTGCLTCPTLALTNVGGGAKG